MNQQFNPQQFQQMQQMQQMQMMMRQQQTQMLQEQQLKEVLDLYNDIVRSCFKKCVTKFESVDLDREELKCINLCAKKYIKHNTRAGPQFQENISGLMSGKD